MKRLISFVLILLLLIGCSSSPKNYIDTDFNEAPSAPREPMVDYPVESEDSVVVENKTIDPTKMIRTGQFTLETRTFDEDIKKLLDDLKQFEGLVESSSISKSGYYDSARVAQYRLRVPSDRFDNFTETLKTHFTVTYEATQNQSVADSYYDAESRIKVLTTQQNRLLDLMESAETVEEIVYIQDQLMRVEQDLEFNQSTLKKLDNQIDYSTISISMVELLETQVLIEEDNFMSQLSRAFARGINNVGHFIGNLTISIVENIIPILILLVIVLIGVKVSKRYKKDKPTIKVENNKNELSE